MTGKSKGHDKEVEGAMTGKSKAVSGTASLGHGRPVREAGPSEA